ncbi:MAG: hypothetical protein KDJ77_19755, partial [Rhodobiaceae bacterium]|nr:hypothetical protein [Rhodobiaceae bacterium]
MVSSDGMRVWTSFGAFFLFREWLRGESERVCTNWLLQAHFPVNAPDPESGPRAVLHQFAGDDHPLDLV